MDIYEIYHTDWKDYIQLVMNKNILFRLSNVKEIGNFINNDNFLMINWDNWGVEYFYKKDGIYYQITLNDKFYLNLYYSELFLIKKDFVSNYFIDNNLKKIYNKDTLTFYGFFTFNEYKCSVCNLLFQHTEEDLLEGFRILQIKFKYQEIKRNLKSAKRKKDFNLIAKYKSDLDNLLNIKRNN